MNIRTLSLTVLVCCMAFLGSCKKDNNDTNDGMVQLLSFGPTGAQHGDTLRVIGTNLNKVNSIQLTGAMVDKANFISQTPDLILLIIPKETQRGQITLNTTQGDIVSKTALNLSVTASISSITAKARPGENIVIKGDYLDWVRRITFANDKLVTDFVSQSINEITVTVPMDAQSGPLVLFFAGTDSSYVETADTLDVTLPMVTAMTPNPVKHQTNLTITGTDLDLAKKIIFAGVTEPVTVFESQSATQIVVKIPAETVKGAVTLQAESGVETSSPMDLDVLLPAVATMSPNPVDPETNLTITGTNLDLVSSILFQNAAPVTAFVSQAATKLVVKVPKGVSEGKITLGVVNSILTVQSNDLLKITGAVPPPVIAFPIYMDAVSSNWNGWTGSGWGGTSNYSNTNPVREGDKSIKIDYVGGWGSPMQLGGASINKGSYTTFKISIYGAPGSGGKTVNLQLNGSGGQSITIVEGKWTDYAFPLSALISGTTVTDMILQETTGGGGFSVYVDDVGLN